MVVDTPRMVQMVFWALRSAQEMRSGDARFTFPTHALQSPACQNYKTQKGEGGEGREGILRVERFLMQNKTNGV